MHSIIYWNTETTTLFAVEELRRLLKKIEINSELYAKAHGPVHQRAIYLLTTMEYKSIHPQQQSIQIEKDGFVILKDDATWIIGNDARAILYGVYAYCRRQYGYQFVELYKETVDTARIQKGNPMYTHEPMFVRRGNVIETINDPHYLRALIDWGVKNGQNEYFFTFFLWDEMKPYLYETLRQRSVDVTLGGHSLSYLLEEIQSQATEAELAEDEKLRFFAENDSLQVKVIDKIVAICKEDRIVTRISLWPEDVGIDEKNAHDFLPTYIRFTEKLKDAIEAEDLPVEVEHIVYNAGLSWDMLERNEATKVSEDVDVLYAFWGRDYSKSISTDTRAQNRALATLKDWKQETALGGKSLTIFEYYSDHFMLSELFPPLLKRINEDLHDYKQMKIDGIVNLIVPVHKKGIHSFIDNDYPWQWVHHMNNYVFTRIAWGIPSEEAIQEYFSLFQKNQAAFIERMETLEPLIASHTKWNSILFPARMVDPEKVENKLANPEVGAYLDTVEKELLSYDLSAIGSLLPIQSATNYTAFTTEEMTLIYFYYLREIVDSLRHQWR